MLVFIPVEYVINVFEEIVEKQIIPEEAQVIVDYFEDVWVERPDRRNNKRKPQFKINMEKLVRLRKKM